MTTPSRDRSQRLQAILHAYLQAVDRGESPDRRAILDAHPNPRAGVAEFFRERIETRALCRSRRGAYLGRGS